MKLINKPAAHTRAVGPTATLETVSPEQAAAILECNHKNRNLSQRAIDLYAADMKAGKWLMTGEAIKLDTAGDVLDGQHRLWAVVQSDTPIETLVVRGLEREAQDVMDTGRKRTAGDALKLNGYKNASLLGAAVRVLINLERGEFVRAAQQLMPLTTHAEVFAYIDNNPDVIDAVSWVSGRRSIPALSRSVAAAALATLRRIDAEQADEFFTDLIEMRTSGSGDPRYVFLRRLQNAKDAGERLSQIEQMHYVFRTWNAMRAGESLRQLKAGKAGNAFQFASPR